MRPIIVLGPDLLTLALAQIFRKSSIPFIICNDVGPLRRRRGGRDSTVMISPRASEALDEILSPSLVHTLTSRSTQQFEFGPHTSFCKFEDLHDVLSNGLESTVFSSQDLSRIEREDGEIKLISARGATLSGSIVISTTSDWSDNADLEDKNTGAGPSSKLEMRKRRGSAGATTDTVKRSRSTTPLMASSTTRVVITPSTSSDLRGSEQPVQAANIFTELSTRGDDRLRNVWSKPLQVLEDGRWTAYSNICVVAEAASAIHPSIRLKIAAALHHVAKLDKALSNVVDEEIDRDAANDLSLLEEGPSSGTGRPLDPHRLDRARRLVPWR